MKTKHNAGSLGKHSKSVGHSKGDGYSPMNRGMKTSSKKMSRPDIELSAGAGRHGVGNSTAKNQA